MATIDDKLADYSSFLSGLILSSSYTYELIGTADVIIRLSGFKALEVMGLPTLQKTSATGYALTLNLNFKRLSPEITMRFGDVILQAVNSADATVGTILLRDWTVKSGNDNPVTAVLTGDLAEGLQVVSMLTTAGDTFKLSGLKGSPKNLGVVGGVKIDLSIPAAREV
ncbi:hypothetical protein BGZ47_007795 [Haplosporangium gracile]|nr:hypothetical protein BGZ47_007795 [Haplosporangium gracile]